MESVISGQKTLREEPLIIVGLGRAQIFHLLFFLGDKALAFSLSLGCFLFEPTFAYARWAHMHRILYVCMSVCDLTKNPTRI